MEKLDLRTLSDEGLHLVRQAVVRQRKQGKGHAEIAENEGISRDQSSRIWSAYQKGGFTALRPKKRGRKKGEGMKLTPEEQETMRLTIIDKTPDQFQMRFMLWTREAVCGLAKKLFGKTISLRCITNYLKRWGMTCQRPTKRAYFCDNIKLDRFMNEEYPKISKRAREENADIYWGDEVGVDNREHYQRGFAPKGKPPVLKVESKKERQNMISAITNKGKLRFMFIKENMTQDVLIEFMRRMIRDCDRKIFLILDNLRVHHGKKVKKWLAKHKDRIELFYLPPYAPEINPDEYFNHGLKQNVHKGVAPRTKDDIRHKIESYTRKLQHSKEGVIAYFRHPKVQFALCDF